MLDKCQNKTKNIMKTTSIQDVNCESKTMLSVFVPSSGTAPVLTCLLLAAALSFPQQTATAGEAPVNLGSAATFGVLAASTVTSTGATMVDGDLGVSPGTTVTGSPTITGTLHLGDPIAAQAQLDLTTAYNDAAGRTVGAITVAGNLGGRTLTPGLYKSTSSLEISSGDLTLDAQGDANAVFIFQMGSTLTTTAGRQVILSGGARAANIFWQVGSSATLGTTSVMKGNVLALASITLTTGATLEGRALARTGAVSMDSNIIGLGIPADTTAPTVSSTVPASAATDVAISGPIAAVFSEAMDPLTLSTTSFTLKQGTTPVAGAVSYSGVTATFTPAGNLAPLTTYAATITTGAKDLAGNALATDFGWSFTTGATPDTTAPTVSATVPANAATGVAINQTISATFSEAMDPLTINTASLLLTGPGTTVVTGTVGYNVPSKIATFTPSSSLAPNTLYTATITTGAKDLAGNPLASGMNWSFTTAATSAGQAPVSLGAATTFAVLAGSTVTCTGGTTVNGDLGVSPGTAVTGFVTVDGGPGIVNGTIYNVTPGPAATAQGDLTTAYNDAAGRTVGAITVAGNLGGQTLAPGLYTSTSSLEISSGDLTLDASGDPNAVWIFQMGSTLTTTVGRQVILSGGAQAANVFWQVGSSATIGGSSVFKGTIMANQSITMNTSATMEGRALARNAAVTLDANTITIPNTGTPAMTLVSAAVVTGPYTAASGHTIYPATKIITVPLSGSMQFYRIRSNAASTITSITISGGIVVIAYN
jgi:hypothetical protein